ncbi:MAG: sigma-70 family RNA polymerase sigma factor [Alphaproteobacteria bacterium]|nr:sigma-70 family RNA polymerase sigma factor [Alphaproteobacteria bacterium]
MRAVLAGEPDAQAHLIRRAADTVWTCCRGLTADEARARAAFESAMAAVQAENFACLRAFDGRSRLDTFLALVVRDFLGRDVLRRVAEDGPKRWSAFEALFGGELRRLVQRRLSGPLWTETRQDAYQEICTGLVADDCHRLAAYDGRGSPGGFVLHVADRLLLDFMRGLRARRRLPAAVMRLAPLDQELFRMVWWRGVREEDLGATLAQRSDPPPSGADIVAALERVRRAVPADYQRPVRQIALSDAPEPETGASPETLMLEGEGEQALALAADALREAAESLSAKEQLYLRLMLAGTEPVPAREMARLMQIPVEDVYRLRQRLMKTLKERLADHPAVKNWLASV